MSIRRFRPRAWSVLAYLPVVALLVGLGTWQTQRGLQKLRLDQAIEQSQDEVDWHAQLRPRLDPPLRVTVAGVTFATPASSRTPSLSAARAILTCIGVMLCP